jgi:hypothetical protein
MINSSRRSGLTVNFKFTAYGFMFKDVLVLVLGDLMANPSL